MLRVFLASPKASIIDEVKVLADEHRWEIGFHSRKAFEESAERSQLIIAAKGRDILGFVRFRHRRDHRTSIYEIVTKADARGSGIGKSLLEEVKTRCRVAGSRSIRLSCPAELAANEFYAASGFRKMGTKSGKNRPLYEWELTLLPRRPLVFVASLTACGSDLVEMIRLWEKHGTGLPFTKCIITPLFIYPGAFEHIRYMHDRWGIDVTFDSGGFFVQQGKIRYDELFVRLLNFYEAHPWAESYVLPDFAPTSSNTPAEVAERVHVTAAEGIKFLKRLPSDLRVRALGVLQGHQPDHLQHCFAEFTQQGLRHLGFGSFDTRGANEEINILTQKAATRLAFVRDLISREFNSKGNCVDLHLFGVSSPTIIESFQRYGATSFDSSGWLRTAGFGNVYLPFRTRRNVSHGAAAVSVGTGMRASDFYAECERSHHTCAFCVDFSQLQRNRFFRMWHNAIVFGEMTKTLNGVPELAMESAGI